jgi:hypothetical protein
MSKKIKPPTKKPLKAAEAPVRTRTKQAHPKGPGARSVPNKGGETGGAPSANARQPKFATFEEAKGAAIDALIRTIEEAEQRLSAVKRTHSFDESSMLTTGQVE